MFWVCLTAGSPYYNPHIQRPALFPPSDGYQPPEDPLVGVARQIQATAALKARHPRLAIVGSAYSYLQEWLPHVAHAVVRTGMADSSASAAWSSAIPSCRPTCSPGVRSSGTCSAARSATARPRRATVSCLAATRSIRSTRSGPKRTMLKEIKAGL